MNMTILLALIIAWAAVFVLKRIVKQSLMRTGLAVAPEVGSRSDSLTPKSRT